MGRSGLIDGMDELAGAGDGQSPVFTPEDCKRLSESARKAFFRLSHVWALHKADDIVLLGLPSCEAYREWRTLKALVCSSDTLERISLLLGIYKSLHIFFNAPLADAWIRRDNSHPLFDNRSPLELMLTGDLYALRQVRLYVDAMGGPYSG